MESHTPLVATTLGTSLPARIATGRTPALFTGSKACERRFWEFFAANIRNKNTRQAYLAAAGIMHDGKAPLFRSSGRGRAPSLY